METVILLNIKLSVTNTFLPIQILSFLEISNIYILLMNTNKSYPKEKRKFYCEDRLNIKI